VAELTEQLADEDDDVRWAAVAELARDPSSLPALVEILKGDNQRAIETAIVALGYMGNGARDARPALHEINRGRHPNSTKRAVRWALDQIRRIPKPARNPVFPDHSP
jgi:HEAT repeat protein